MENTTETLTETDPNARYIVNPITTEEQIQAIRALAGLRKGDTTTSAWVEEMEKYREQVRQEEIARQVVEDKSK